MLDDIVVLELGTSLATASAGKMLRDAGATVVLVEPVDPTSTAADPDQAAYVHGGKRSVTTTSWELADEHPGLVARADAVLCDRPDLVAVARGLRRVRPGLVVVSVSDYGSTSTHPPATDFTLQAESGLSAIHPTGNRPPVATGVPASELAAATHAAIGVVAGLLSREAGGGAVDADVSRFESLVATLQFPWVFTQHEQHTPYTVPVSAVPGIEQAKDGWVCVVCVTPQQWVDFKAMAGVPELDDPRFDQLIDRQDLVAELTPLIRRFTGTRTVEELVRAGAAARVPIVPVSTSTSVVDLPPYAERGSFVTHPDGFTQPRPPQRVAGATWEPGRRPRRGEADRESWGVPPERTRRIPGDPGQPLKGLRVVELGSFQAGPLAARALAALGADVVKIESVTRPDLLRFGGPLAEIPEAWERGASFTGTNWGKRSLTADLKDPDGIDIVRRLVTHSDAVIENFSPRVLDAVGLDPAGIEELRPGAVVMRLPAWGSTGTWKDVPGFTYSADAACGLSDLTGYPDGPPTLTGTTIDPLAADISTFVALAALRRQLLTGQGASIEVPLCDVALQLTASAVVTSSRTGVAVSRSGNESPGVVPQGLYRTREDAWIAIAVTGDEQWAALRRVMGQHAPSHREHAGPGWRLEHRALVDAAVRKWVGSRTAEDLVLDLHAHGVPAAVMATGLQAHDDLRLVARGRTMTLSHPVNGEVVHLRAPVVLSFQDDSNPRRSPLFGEHNAEILTELGYSEGQIDELRTSGKVGVSPFGLPTSRT
jgi:crotonobetainyl-CoA:carnitine CoA-transferase CaiB-like acyl-CoA transferase